MWPAAGVKWAASIAAGALQATSPLSHDHTGIAFLVNAPLNNTDLLARFSNQWDLDFVRWRECIPLAGSPERTTWRCVAQTRDGQLYLLEKIASRVYDRKRRIQRVLRQLHAYGLEGVVPYLPDRTGEGIPLIDHGLWQLCPFVAGVELDRPAYTMNAWRGDAAADFLIRLHAISIQHRLAHPWPSFAIAAYIHDLMAVLSRHEPETAAHYRPFVDYLETTLFPIVDRLPVGFCHGDYHPLNIIWGERSIRAVIDWEFCGAKPELFDLANLVGCLGMEDPRSLTGPFVAGLCRSLRRAGLYAQASWKALPDLVLAIRFAWLSEWMRKDDRPMIQMEADYMSLLMEHRPALHALFSDEASRR